MQLEAPDTILPNEHFETKCWGSGMVRMHVHHCPSVRLQQTCTDGEFCEILHVTHVEKACEVTCVSGSKVLQKKILVKGKQEDLKYNLQSYYKFLCLMYNRGNYHIRDSQYYDVERNAIHIKLYIEM